ncbi:MAG: ABA4-like family protein [Oceanicoccus sp.]
MNLETVFSLSGSLAMLGWLGLVFLPGQKWMVEVVARLVIPCVIAVIYVFLMLSNFQYAPAEGGFGSLAAVKSLFTVDALLLGGWIHYLAFDLFVGSWIVSNSRVHSVYHLLVIPCLALTFMAGPAGLLAYILIREAVRLYRRKMQ